MATDGTQYLIELAAKFTGGDAAVAKLGELGDKMLAAGATSKDLETATKAASTALEQAAAAAMNAGTAIAEGEKAYRSAELAADRAAKAVEKIGTQAEAQVGKLQAALDVGDVDAVEGAEAQIWKLLGRQQELIAVSSKAGDALKSEAAAMDKLKSSAEAAATKHNDLKKGVANLESAAAKAAKVEKAAAGTGKVNEMAEAFGKLGGPAGVAGQKVLILATGFDKLKMAMGTAGPYVAIAIAIVAIASAAIAATYAITKWGVSNADANRSNSLLVAGIAQSVKGGQELEEQIAKVGRVVPLTNDELKDMAKKLADSGLSGKELNAALEKTALNAAELKFGPEFQKEMLSLNFQAKRLDSNIAKTFGGLNIDKFLASLSNLVDLFDSSTASGKTLKFIFEGLFQPIVDGATDGVYFIERMFLHAEIMALKAYIALRPYSDGIVLLGKAFLIGAAVIGGILAVAVGVLIAGLTAVLALIGVLAFGIFQFGVMIKDAAVAIVEGFGPAVEWLADLGNRMIEGLVNAITGGATAVIGAIGGVITGAIDSAKSLLGIASKSKVFASIGGFAAEGFTSGVDSGADDAQGAMESMVAPPDAGGGGGGKGGGGGLSLSIGELHVHGEGAKAQADNFIDEITKRLESLGIIIGGGEVPAV